MIPNRLCKMQDRRIVLERNKIQTLLPLISFGDMQKITVKIVYKSTPKVSVITFGVLFSKTNE